MTRVGHLTYASWLEFANDLGIKAAALFDNDEAGQAAYAQAYKKFKNNPMILLLKLPTADIRDKPDQGNERIFDESWKLKSRYQQFWNDLLDKVVNFFGEGRRPSAA